MEISESTRILNTLIIDTDMIDNPIKIERANQDLPLCTESWRVSSYREKVKEFYDFFHSQKGHSPSGNMEFIRCISFPVPPEINLCDIISLGVELCKRFHIECFQATIDRESGMAYMLCNWYDKESNACVYFYKSKFIRLATLIIHALDLNISQFDYTWHRCILNEEYNDNKEVFDEVEDWVKHSHPTSKTYKIIKHALQYAKKRVEGLTK